MHELFNSPLTGVILCLGSYLVGYWVQKRTKSVLANPFLIATVLCISLMQLLGITLEQFNRGGNLISFFLAPATCVLALSIYRQRILLGKFFVPIVLGCVMSSAVSLGATFLLAPLFSLDKAIVASISTGRITTAIAVDIVEGMGGIVPIAILVVVITGMAGAILAPLLIKVLKITNEIEMGVSIGATSHVIGTSKAVELGEVQGAMSSVAIGITGLATVFLTLFL